MRKINITFVIIALFILAFSESVFSQGFGRGFGRGLGWWRTGCLNSNYSFYPNLDINYPNLLGLTQEQITKINEIQTNLYSENLSLLNDLNRKNLELQNLMMVQPIDQTVVNYKIDEINKVQAEMQKKLIAQKSEIEKMLTKEQKALLNSNNLAFGRMGMPGFGYGTNRMFGRGLGPCYYNYGWNTFGGRGMGRGPCGMGLGRSGLWNQWW